MRTEKYIEQKNRLPETGKRIIGRLENNSIIVYQAFNHHIADYAVSRQRFDDPHYSFNRMSWIKPGFLWMMYRSGWATKDNQQKILAISLQFIHFKTILSQATLTSFDEKLFATIKEWKTALDKTDVRLQWDPDHDPFGNKQERKAIQIGMKGEVLNKFCTEWISGIEDITGFVKEQHEKVLKRNIDDLEIPNEEIVELNDPMLEKKLGIINE